MKWKVGSRSGARVITERLPGKRVTVKCDCGSEPHTISLPSFLQSPRCRECAKDGMALPDGTGSPAYDREPLMLYFLEPHVVSLTQDAKEALHEQQGNWCAVCLSAEEPDDRTGVTLRDAGLYLVCEKCRPLLIYTHSHLDAALNFGRSLDG